MELDESTAWFEITSTAGLTLRTNSSTDYEPGARFVAVLDASGTQLGWWVSESWGGESQARQVMSQIWELASSGATAYAAGYGIERTFDLPHGAVRVGLDGNYVRMVDADGEEHDEGSAYWDVQEWVSAPELVMGAIFGAAGDLA